MFYRYFNLSLLLIFISCHDSLTVYRDISFHSEVLATDRNYRIYLPGNYDQNKAVRYPVVYYFHGFGGRYKWDTYDVEDDVHYPENGRKEPPFVMEWQKYVNENEVIIVSWDGYEPNLHEGKKEREGIRYGNALPYDYVRAHEQKNHHWGWDFSLHFRELVNHVDQQFRTIADREHRGITGLSMGGLTAYYVAGQNKDLVSSVSAFDPADNLPKYGPKEQQVVFPILQMSRPLKGMAVRLTMTDGDWLKYNNWRMQQMFEAADLSYFESHVAHYPNHWAADIDKQLDFHMREFKKGSELPENWDHINPAFPSFDVFGYKFDVQRERPALTILENVSNRQMKVLGRHFIPDGPIVQDEKLSVLTPAVYAPNEPYQLIAYNLSKGEIQIQNEKATNEGNLSFELDGGGYLLGINGSGSGTGPKVNMIFNHNQENFYFEEGVDYDLDFKLVNVGNKEAKDIQITALSSHPYLNISNTKIKVSRVEAASQVSLENQFNFHFTQYNDSISTGNLLFEIKVDGEVSDTTRILTFLTPKSPYVKAEDVIVLDGRSVDNIPIYRQGPNKVEMQSISGGEGNGNGLLEQGEKALVYIRLSQGLGPNDLNTFHRTYLINHLDEPYINVEELNYEERVSQASATSVATVLSLSEKTPINQELDLWFKVESLYNDAEDTTSNATIYAHKYDYVRALLKVGSDGN